MSSLPALQPDFDAAVWLAAARHLGTLTPPGLDGVVTQVLGLLIEGSAHGAALGDIYTVRGRHKSLSAEVVALRGTHALLLPIGHIGGLEVGARLVRQGAGAKVGCGPALLGRVIDAMGMPLDGQPAPVPTAWVPLHRQPLPLGERAPITRPLATGVRAIDAMVPLGEGQRIGIYAGPGVGKSVLLGMMAQNSACDVAVLALVGERGREVNHFVERVLGPRGLRRAVVVASSDRPASERVRAAQTATAVAEHFRDHGQKVLLFVDSLTRLCMARRDIGLATGEPPTSKGYPPSAFSLLPSLLERVAPARAGGSITGIYTVLVEGDDLQDPVADTTRALLDGHVVLSRTLALRGHFPAIDILHSLSRLEPDLLPDDERRAARQLRRWMGRVEDARDLIAVGAYRPGNDAELDTALQMVPRVEGFLAQDLAEATPVDETYGQLRALAQVGAR